MTFFHLVRLGVSPWGPFVDDWIVVGATFFEARSRLATGLGVEPDDVRLAERRRYA